MASSSRTHKDYDLEERGEFHEGDEDDEARIEEEEEGGGEGNEERDWLELGLGFGSPSCRKLKAMRESNHSTPSSTPIMPPFSSSSSTSLLFPSHQTHKKLALELGLGLGLPANYHKLCLQQQHHDGDYMPSSKSPSMLLPLHSSSSNPFTWFKSPPSLSGIMPLPLDSSSSCFLGLHDLLMPVPQPNDSHHYAQRPQSGLWFTLRSSTNREGELLPQIAKAYIRVKRDENVTVFMVKTYLVTKLGLPNEAEIDISCMGQKLLHLETLKYVRDFVWLPRLVESVNSIRTPSPQNPHDISRNHLMSLDYGKRC